MRNTINKVWPLCVVGARFYVRRGAHLRRNPRYCDHVEIVSPPATDGVRWRVLVRVIKPRECQRWQHPHSSKRRNVGDTMSVAPSRLVPLT